MTIKKTATIAILSLSLMTQLPAVEVDKEKIPAEHLVPTLKMLPWNTPIWDVDEAIAAIQNNKPVLWVDTRTASFLTHGSLLGAVNLVYDKTGASIPATEKILTKESLEAAIKAAGLDPATAVIAFFCQGPKCHRSYNASFVAVNQWGFKPEQVIWFRDGYPVMETKITEDPMLKRKAKKFLNSDGVQNLK